MADQLPNLTASQFGCASILDDITPLYSYLGFLTLGYSLLERAKREGHHALVFCLDVDHLATIRRVNGVPSSQRVMHIVAWILRRMFPAPSVIGRLNGDEFAVVLHASVEANEDRILTDFDRALAGVVGKESFPFEVSVASAVARIDFVCVSDLKSALSIAMRAAVGKKQHRCRLKPAVPTTVSRL